MESYDPTHTLEWDMRPRAEENLETLSNLSGKCKKSLKLMRRGAEISNRVLCLSHFSAEVR